MPDTPSGVCHSVRWLTCSEPPGRRSDVRGSARNLVNHYGVRRVVGFRNGYQGFIASYRPDVVDLTPQSVRDINVDGGTVLGTSRTAGPARGRRLLGATRYQRPVRDRDGTMHGAMQIASVIDERGAQIAVVGVPKTIDNDIPYLDQSFGFQTAFARATESIHAVTVEAKATVHGVGLVKLMGRHSGFIACYAALARNDADVVLIPEVPFRLDGDAGLLHHVQRRVQERGYAVVVVAEGAGQELLGGEVAANDASGNTGLGDVGALLRR